MPGFAIRHQFRAVALEYDDFNNASRWPEFREKMLNASVLPGVWITNGNNLRDCPADASFVVAEIEDHADYDGIIAAIPFLPNIPRAVITTFWGLLVYREDGSLDIPATKARCKPLIDAGFCCQTEFYYQGIGRQATPAHLEDVAINQCGWKSEDVAPVFGVYTPYQLQDYEEHMGTKGWGVYLAEYLPA